MTRESALLGLLADQYAELMTLRAENENWKLNYARMSGELQDLRDEAERPSSTSASSPTSGNET